MRRITLKGKFPGNKKVLRLTRENDFEMREGGKGLSESLRMK